MELIRGMDVVASINEKLIAQIEQIKQKEARLPQLAIIRVGENTDDISYEHGAGKRMDKVGILHREYHYPEDVEHDYFYEEFERINADPEVDGILVLLPLPEHLEEEKLAGRIDPAKDMDGISPINQAKVMAGERDGYAPCTPEAVIEILDYAGIDLTGKRVTIVGRSMVVGKPLAMLMMNRHATVTVCHTRTKNLKQNCRNAEILVTAAGQARLLDAGYVGENAVVLDVGINVDAEGHLCGDVDLESLEAAGNAAVATPVPGGVGMVTTSVLAKHVLQAYRSRE